MPFMTDYHQGTLEILSKLEGELAQIGALTSRAAAVIRGGGTVWTSMNSGHMPIAEQADDRRGSPGLLKSDGDFELLQAGDMVFTQRCNRDVLAARQRGVYVVCVTTNYQDNEFRPAGFTDISHSNPDGLMLGDVSNEILHSHVPYQQGLVWCKEIADFALCPSSTTGSATVHWLINAELTHKVGNEGAAEVGPSAEYLRILRERVEKVAQHQEAIGETAALMSERVLEGGRWFAQSLEHAGFYSEFNVASGPRIVNTGDWAAHLDKNIMLISAISPAFAGEIELAQAKKGEGAYLIGIGPAGLDGEVPQPNLLGLADAPFDNFSPESGGVIEASGHTGGICPTSGVVGNVIQQMISAQWAEEMVKRGAVPTFLRGVYQNGGTEYNTEMETVFAQRGY
ncbi:MAG: hypothetical protein GKR89_04115 [Candidatus Latescibacteria bacterium]|nr:hypothetical protein [Candidatus Latescibacterota bacterium]